MSFTPTGDSAYETTILEATATTLKFTQVETLGGVKYTSTLTASPKP